jgi:hypothetical protein
MVDRLPPAKPILNEGGEIRVSVSIGGAVAKPGETPDPALLIRTADRALYRAKEAGRNQCIIDAEVTADCDDRRSRDVFDSGQSGRERHAGEAQPESPGERVLCRPHPRTG